MAECPPCNRETGVRFPVGSDQRLLKVVPDAALLGTKHEGLDCGKFPVTYCHRVQGVYMYIKLPHATETGDGPSDLARQTNLLKNLFKQTVKQTDGHTHNL